MKANEENQGNQGKQANQGNASKSWLVSTPVRGFKGTIYIYSLKKLTMNPNSRCSLQYHKKKIETIFVLEGTLYIKLGRKINKLKTIKLQKGQSILINVSGGMNNPFTISNCCL